MRTTTIVFDFGNVLGLFSHRRAAEQLAAYSTDSPERIQKHLFDGQLEDDYESGRISTHALMERVRENCHVACTDAQFAKAVGDMFTPNEPVCALVPRLRPRYRLLLLSNTNDLHARQFTAQFADVLAHFDKLVLSYQVGLRKPDPAIYAYCERMAGVPPGEVLFIDDLPSNVEAARDHGWQGIVYRPGTDLRPQLAAAGVVLAPQKDQPRRREA
jgi:putative hydrolase of the HAD superfamily